VFETSYPASVSAEALIDAAARLTGEPRDAVERIVMATLEELLILGALRIRRTPVPAATEVSGLPQALAAVRGAPGLALSAGANAQACNQWHESVALTLLERSLLPLLDGAHSHDALVEHLAAEVRADRLRFIKDEKPLTDPAELEEFAQQQVALALRELRRKALLTA
jgi:hypothetical protein